MYFLRLSCEYKKFIEVWMILEENAAKINENWKIIGFEKPNQTTWKIQVQKDAC